MSPFQAYKKYCNGCNTRNNVFSNNTFPNDDDNDDDDDDDDAAEMRRMEAGNAEEDVQSGGDVQQPVLHNETAVKPIPNIKIVNC
jgi:hypothetical protein